MVFNTLSNSEGCLIRPSEAKPHSPNYSELATALIFFFFLTFMYKLRSSEDSSTWVKLQF